MFIMPFHSSNCPLLNSNGQLCMKRTHVHRFLVKKKNIKNKTKKQKQKTKQNKKKNIHTFEGHVSVYLLAAYHLPPLDHQKHDLQQTCSLLLAIYDKMLPLFFLTLYSFSNDWKIRHQEQKQNILFLKMFEKSFHLWKILTLQEAMI